MSFKNRKLDPSGTVQDGSEPSYRPLPIREDGSQDGSGPAPAPRFAPVPLTDDDDHRSLEWYSIADVARLSRRAPSTVRDIISKYQLRRRLAWQVYGRKRRRVTMVSPNVARWIQAVTLFRQPPEFPPR